MFEIIELLITNLWKLPLTIIGKSCLRINILKLKWNSLLQIFETLIGPIENYFLKKELNKYVAIQIVCIQQGKWQCTT